MMPDVAHGFQLHQSREAYTAVTEILEKLASTQPDWRVGATMHLPRQQLSYWSQVSDEWTSLAAFLVADPESPRLDLSYDERGRGRDDYDYLGESEPAANVERFVSNVLQAQRYANATVLVSPWMLHGTSQTEHELSTTIRFAEVALAQASDEHLLMGIEATEGVFANNEARNAMINELVEGPELPMYLRMRVNPPAGYMPYQDGDALSGLREVVRSLDSNDRPVALPQSGLAGWLMCAFGARSFGAGIAGSMQRTAAPAKGGGGLPPLHWYFLPQMLGFVLAEEVEDLAELDGFNVCDCPYCDEELPGEGASFDSTEAGRHFIWWCARLASELDPGDPARSINERVNAALEFSSVVRDAGIQLDYRSRPTHLPVWRDVLDG
ncbi:MAG TPA: hypothetical protein VMB05_18125 [Solirubrobacteraceae bacterium]|nr:hypothetical protein [Solirubrobacteraceae bacterium]